MKRRFAINNAGELVDRDGYVLGRVTSLTLEMGADVELPQGGLQGVKPSAEPQRLETAEAGGGGVGEESLEPDPVDAVWATYVEVMGPRKKDLDPGGRRVIKDALKVATVDRVTSSARAPIERVPRPLRRPPGDGGDAQDATGSAEMTPPPALCGGQLTRPNGGADQGAAGAPRVPDRHPARMRAP